MKTAFIAFALLLGSAAQAASCGWVSDFDIAPRARDLYEAKIISIDGQPPGTSLQRKYRVSPGRHEVVVAERIEKPDLGLNARFRRDRHHTLIVDVQPNQRYCIAAKFKQESRLDTRGGYWEPQVWQARSAPCR